MRIFYKTWHCTAADMKTIIATEQSDASKILLFITTPNIVAGIPSPFL